MKYLKTFIISNIIFVLLFTTIRVINTLLTSFINWKLTITYIPLPKELREIYLYTIYLSLVCTCFHLLVTGDHSKSRLKS